MINWAIAAPLFSINFFVLSAIFQRSAAPLKQLVSPEGFQGLVEQAVRVLALGPLDGAGHQFVPAAVARRRPGTIRMAPCAPVAATIANLFLPVGSFRVWSLAVFTGLLAYDWLRVLIWFDHMGLRVATLVNLSSSAATGSTRPRPGMSGYAGRTRVIPEGIRRFATWAPLLIPFYIPRGADWDKAWTGAETDPQPIARADRRRCSAWFSPMRWPAAFDGVSCRW